VPKLDIHEVDEGYSVALQMLVFLDDAAADGLRAADLAALLRDDVYRAGAWLRDLRCRGWVYKQRVSPGRLETRWYITEGGHAYLNETVAGDAT
jgi:hypothetical protein